MEEQPQDPRQSSANFLNVLGVALSGLAIIAVLISLFLTQMSLNDISMTLSDLEEKIEIAEEDIDTILEDEEVVEEETTEEEMGTQVITLYRGFNMEIPADWQVQSNVLDTLTVITATIPYVITETIEIEELDELTGSYNLVDETDYVSVYQIGCAPAMGCYAVEVDDELYSMDWTMAESTEPVPDNFDGVWFPEANFDQDDIEEIMLSIMPATK